MDMADIDVIEQLKGRFSRPLEDYAERRIVVWHDPEGEFFERFQALAGEEGLAFAGEDTPAGPVRCLEVVDGNTFATKKLVCRDEVGANFLLYRRRTRARLEGDWLADVEMYAEHFQADYTSMLLDQLNIADLPETRGVVSRAKAFFSAKSRIARFSACVPQASSRADVLMGVFCVALDADAPTVEAVVRAYVCLLLEETAESGSLDAVADKTMASPTRKLLEKYGVDQVFSQFLQVKLGYCGDTGDIDELSAHLLVSALSLTVPPEARAGLEPYIAQGNAQFCLGVVRDWSAQGEDERSRLYEACRRVERMLSLARRFDNIDVEQLLGADVFPAINESILKSLITSIAQGADRGEETLRIVQQRKEMKRFGRVEPFFSCAAEAARMLSFKREYAAGFHETDAAAVWKAYTQDWWRMDSFYRSFCTSYQLCARLVEDALDDCIHELAIWADNLYTHWFLAQSNACWVNAAAGQWAERGAVAGIARQRRFYDDNVSTELANAKRVVVAVSDAMRYEVAQQVASRLERETRGTARVEAMQSVFPSETRFGMAALLPHRQLQYREATDEVLVDSLPTAGLKAREAVLQSRRPASRAIQYADLLQMSTRERKQFASDAQVVYVYHNTIDAAGHGEVSGQSVFDACEDAVRDMVDLVRIATNQLGASRVILTADHGFLHTRCDIPESQQASRNEVSGEVNLVERRFLRADAHATSEVFVGMNMTDVDGGAYTWWAARDCVRIKASGSRNFVHGGISLQELCVPVVRFRNARAGQKNYVEQQFANLCLVDRNRRITSTIFNLQFYQPDAVGGKVLPCEYELMLTDKMGNNVSDIRRAHADNASELEADRMVRVQFMLKPGVTWHSDEPYYLVMRNKQTGETVLSEKFRVDIAFAPIEDFGF